MILIFFTNDINEYPLTSTFIIGLLLQYKNIKNLSESSTIIDKFTANLKNPESLIGGIL